MGIWKPLTIQSEISLVSSQMCLPARNDLVNEIKFLVLIPNMW